jgi:putative membrane protein
MNWYGRGRSFIMDGNFMLFTLVSMVVKLILLVVVIVIAVKLFKKYYSKVDAPKVKEDAAVAILRERFAKGEIDVEEFQKRKVELEQTKLM